MKQFLLLFYSFFFCICGNAQETFTIEQGYNIIYSIPFNEVYAYPSFTDGAVYYKSGNAGGGRLNYNYLTQELVFINEKKDTMAVDGSEETDSVIIGNSRWYYHQGFVKIDTITGTSKLAVRYIFSPADKKVVGYNGISTSSTSNMTYIQYKLDPATTKVADEQIVLMKNRVLFIGDRMNHFMEVNKKNLFRFYSKQQAALKKYLDENNFDSNKRGDVINLMLFMEVQ